MLNKIPPLPNGLLPKLVFYPSETYSDMPRSGAAKPLSEICIMAETDEIVLFAYWDQVSEQINRYQTHLKIKPSDYED